MEVGAQVPELAKAVQEIIERQDAMFEQLTLKLEDVKSKTALFFSPGYTSKFFCRVRKFFAG